jgi:hypothetical protein
MDVRLNDIDQMDRNGLLTFIAFFIECVDLCWPRAFWKPRVDCKVPAANNYICGFQIRQHAPPSSNLSSGLALKLTFINPPPLQFAHFFQPVKSNGRDQIEGHIKMFDITLNNEGYTAMLARAADAIVKVAAPRSR